MSDILKLAREHQLKQEHIKVQKENRLLRETLEFYADTKNYKLNENFYEFKKSSESTTHFLHKVDRDEGDLARKILRKLQ